MKVTTSKIRQIIKEELSLLVETYNDREAMTILVRHDQDTESVSFDEYSQAMRSLARSFDHSDEGDDSFDADRIAEIVQSLVELGMNDDTAEEYAYDALRSW